MNDDFDDARQTALRLAEGLSLTAANIVRVGRETSPEAAVWAFGQWELRARAGVKFGRASEMLFTKEALEQATHGAVASYHASRFPAGAPVADLTAGIGADAMALARRGPIVAFEIDPERAACARHNLGLVSSEAANQVFEGDCLEAPWDFRYAFADPSRRSGGRRTMNPSEFSPNPLDLAIRMRRLSLGGIKLSPMLSDGFLESLGGSLEFVSFGGECREALVWLGGGAGEGRWAVRAETGERLAAGEPGPATDLTGRFLYEADPAAIRAHALGALCGAFDLAELGDSNGYLTGEFPVGSPWLQIYEVLGESQGDLKRLRAELRNLGGGSVVVKSRAKAVDVARLATMLRGTGEIDLIVAAYPLGSAVRYVPLRKL